VEKHNKGKNETTPQHLTLNLPESSFMILSEEVLTFLDKRINLTGITFEVCHLGGLNTSTKNMTKSQLFERLTIDRSVLKFFVGDKLQSKLPCTPSIVQQNQPLLNYFKEVDLGEELCSLFSD
jgi:hypothetical protein